MIWPVLVVLTKTRVEKIILGTSLSNKRGAASVKSYNPIIPGSPCPGAMRFDSDDSNGGDDGPKSACKGVLVATDWYRVVVDENGKSYKRYTDTTFDIKIVCDFSTSMSAYVDDMEPCAQESGDGDTPVIEPEDCHLVELELGEFANSCEEGFADLVLAFLQRNGGYNINLRGLGIREAEEQLIKRYPVQAMLAWENQRLAEETTRQKFGYNGEDDCTDAFRHAYFNALNARDFGKRIAKLFSDAHETEVPPNKQYAIPMDIHNNAVGHQVGDAAGLLTTAEDLSDEICQRLKLGKLKAFSNGQLVSSNGCGC